MRRLSHYVIVLFGTFFRLQKELLELRLPQLCAVNIKMAYFIEMCSFISLIVRLYKCWYYFSFYGHLLLMTCWTLDLLIVPRFHSYEGCNKLSHFDWYNSLGYLPINRRNNFTGEATVLCLPLIHAFCEWTLMNSIFQSVEGLVVGLCPPPPAFDGTVMEIIGQMVQPLSFTKSSQSHSTVWMKSFSVWLPLALW